MKREVGRMKCLTPLHLSRTGHAEGAEMCVVMAIDAYRCEIHDGSRGGTEPRSSAFLIFNYPFLIFNYFLLHASHFILHIRVRLGRYQLRVFADGRNWVCGRSSSPCRRDWICCQRGDLGGCSGFLCRSRCRTSRSGCPCKTRLCGN